MMITISSIVPFSSFKKTEEPIPADTVKTIAKDFKLKTLSGDYNTTNDRLIVIDKMGYIRFKGNQSAIKDIDAAKQKVNKLLSE